MTTANANFSFPVRIVKGLGKWCALSFVGADRIEVVAYTIDLKQDISFIGGHRHRHAVVRDDIHVKFADKYYPISLDISGVKGSIAPAQKKGRRHHKG